MSISKRIVKGRPQYRFITRYKTHAGEWKQKGSAWFPTKREAEEAQQEFRKSLKANGTTVRGDTFSKIYKEWIGEAIENNTAETVRSKRQVIETYCADLMDKNIAQILPADIKKIFESERFSALSSYRKNLVYSWVSSVFDYAMRFYGLAMNPVKVLPRFRETVEEKLKEVEIYDRSQFRDFLEAVPDGVHKDLFFFLYWTGLRLNEALSLTFDDVKGTSVKVWRQWDKEEMKFRQLKTKGSNRIVALDPDLMKTIANRQKEYMALPGFSGSWFIFGGPRHLPYTTIERVKKKAIEATGLPPVKIHSFRHSHASNLIAAGVPIFKISKRLGHSSVSMTQDVYGHLIRNDEDDILSAMALK